MVHARKVEDDLLKLLNQLMEDGVELPDVLVAPEEENDPDETTHPAFRMQPEVIDLIPNARLAPKRLHDDDAKATESYWKAREIFMMVEREAKMLWVTVDDVEVYPKGNITLRCSFRSDALQR